MTRNIGVEPPAAGKPFNESVERHDLRDRVGQRVTCGFKIQTVRAFNHAGCCKHDPALRRHPIRRLSKTRLCGVPHAKNEDRIAVLDNRNRSVKNFRR